jgi:hypothetical protein
MHVHVNVHLDMHIGYSAGTTSSVLLQCISSRQGVNLIGNYSFANSRDTMLLHQS